MIKKLRKYFCLAMLILCCMHSMSSVDAANMNTEVTVITDEVSTVEDDSVGVHNGSVKINEINFPDGKFREYLSEVFDTDNDGYINVSDVTSINCMGKEIVSLEGIEFFEELTDLKCSNNQLTSLDVSKCTGLTVLWCSNNQLTSLDISKCTELTDLMCYGNEFASLDVSKCTELTFLDCGSNQLNSLDVSECTELIFLYCDNNQLTSLNISECTGLTVLYCYSNQLSSLDIGDNLQLSMMMYDLSDISLKGEFKVNNIVLTSEFKKSGFNLSQVKGLKTTHITDSNYDQDSGVLNIKFEDFDEGLGYAYNVETESEPNIQIQLTGGDMSDDDTDSEDQNVNSTTSITTTYHTHIQTYGDSQEVKKNGEMAGTSGESKRLENIWIKVEGDDDLGIQYSTHCQSYGWMPWSCNGETNGTAGEAKRLEAIKIQLTGADKDKYDVYYRVHAQNYGWLGWAKNGEPAGTAGYAKRLEGIQIIVLSKGSEEPGDTYAGVTGSAINQPYYSSDNTTPTISGADTINVKYRTHVQTYGWQGFKYNGAMSGTSGQSKRLEGIEIEITNQMYDGDIVYTTHVQTYGWQGEPDDETRKGWMKNGEMSGTSGESKRLEAICIDLTGEMSDNYDIYYRVHAQTYGWLGWAKNGEPAGTAGYSKRLEGIQIVLVPKGGDVHEHNYVGITADDTRSYVSP